jgi:transitional endoplasmic reticulum ATPase
LTEKYPKGIELTVMDSEPDKVGTGYVSISREVMNELGLVPGDVIEITGKKITHALVWPLRHNVDRTVIRMDGTIRKNAGVSLGDIVTVRPAKLKHATRIVLAPLNQSIPPDFISYAKTRLIERQFYNPRPVTKGDIINISIGIGGVFSFVVISVTPGPAGIVTDSTEIVIREEAVKEEALQVPAITFEDIGDLEEAKMKIREIVELPLKHPELFKRLGIDPPKGVLLHGPPGTGKTLLTEKYPKGIELTVMDSEPDKVGTGYVSISREVMNELGLVPGDVIEITGKKNYACFSLAFKA